MIFTLSQIIIWLETYRYFVLFPVTIVEGPIITIIAGSLTSGGLFNFWIVYAIAIMGDTIGDTLYFLAGKWGGRRFRRNWGKLLDVRLERAAKLEKYFKKHAGKTLFWGKFGYGIVGTLLFTAGVADVPYGKFITFTFLATLVKSFILLLVGFYFGYAYAQIKYYLDFTSYLMIASAILLLLIYLYFQRRSKKILHLENNNESK